MAPTTVVLEGSYYKGDSWPGMHIDPVTINGLQPALALASCRMQFRDADRLLGYELNSVPATGKGLIIITNAATWEMDITDQILDMPAGRYNWDLETTDAGGNVLTIYKGKLTVKQDVTHD
jgi:hypothetical protein